MVERLLEFVPDHYRKEIELAGTAPEQQEMAYVQAKKQVEQLNWSAYTTYERIDQMLVTALTDLRPFWTTRPMEVLAIYRKVAVNMHQA